MKQNVRKAIKLSERNKQIWLEKTDVVLEHEILIDATHKIGDKVPNSKSEVAQISTRYIQT